MEVIANNNSLSFLMGTLSIWVIFEGTTILKILDYTKEVRICLFCFLGWKLACMIICCDSMYDCIFCTSQISSWKASSSLLNTEDPVPQSGFCECHASLVEWDRSSEKCGQNAMKNEEWSLFGRMSVTGKLSRESCLILYMQAVSAGNVWLRLKQTFNYQLKCDHAWLHGKVTM